MSLTGVEPKWLFLERRYNDLDKAIDRYTKSGLGCDEVVYEWKIESVQIIDIQREDGRYLEYDADSETYKFHKG